ncbi:MAG: CarD family transcriptional regulator [Lachnospiraceae bacterium]|nr:CarD family transcriptional regulator [Lachnospiraceae bacterium]
MYKIDDLVMYRNIGVCKIVDITKREQFDSVGEYYTLKPVNDERSTIFVNVNNKNVMMRYLLPAEEVRSIVDNLEQIDGYSCDNDRERDAHYRELINSGKTTNWVQVIKGLYHRKLDRNKKGKDLSQQEERLFRTAEKLFYSEISCVLNIPMEQVVDYITEKVGHSIRV